METKTFAIKGHVMHSKSQTEIVVYENSYVVCSEGKVAGIFESLPEKFKDIPVQNCTDKLVVPGFNDLHLHAPQFAFRGLGMDLELLDWLQAVTFPAEARYSDMEYAKKAYDIFVTSLKASATTRACMFGTMHLPATLLLMDLLEKSGLKCHVGKVNMDRNSPDILREDSAAASLAATEEWLQVCKGRYTNTKPILTPRFVPSCTDELMNGLQKMRAEHSLPVQSHLSENISETSWIKELRPSAAGYADAYMQNDMLNNGSIMAHCVHLTEEEIDLLAQQGTYVAHCANSNTCLSSGIAPVRKMLRKGVRVGLGTDIAGGFSLCMLRTICDTVQVSKLAWRLQDDKQPALTVAEAFYLATRGGGAFFGKVGSFDEGFEFDALVLNDELVPTPMQLSPRERLERLVYLASDACVEQKYVAGVQVKG